MVIVINTYVCHLETNKMYCTNNLHEKEYSVQTTFCIHFDYMYLKHTCLCGLRVMNNEPPSLVLI